MLDRLANYWRVWRHKGSASMDHRLLAYWVLTGRYRGHKRALEGAKRAVRAAEGIRVSINPPSDDNP